MHRRKFSVPAVEPGISKVTLVVPEFLWITGIGRTKFYSEVKAGRIKVVHVGRRTLIPATEPAAWLARLSRETA